LVFRVLLAGDAEARGEEYVAGDPLHRVLDRHQRSKTTRSLSQSSVPYWPRETPRCSSIP